jgi:hypothetical protein
VPQQEYKDRMGNGNHRESNPSLSNKYGMRFKAPLLVDFSVPTICKYRLTLIQHWKGVRDENKSL